MNPSNELDLCIRAQVKAKPNSTDLEIDAGDKLYVYMNQKKTHRSRITLVVAIAYEVEALSRSRGIAFYRTTAREVLRHAHITSTVIY